MVRCIFMAYLLKTLGNFASKCWYAYQMGTYNKIVCIQQPYAFPEIISLSIST